MMAHEVSFIPGDGFWDLAVPLNQHVVATKGITGNRIKDMLNGIVHSAPAKDQVGYSCLPPRWGVGFKVVLFRL